MLCFVLLCYVMLSCVMLCYVMLCYVMLCYVMLCYVMLCYVMLCYDMIWYVRRISQLRKRPHAPSNGCQGKAEKKPVRSQQEPANEGETPRKPILQTIGRKSPALTLWAQRPLANLQKSGKHGTCCPTLASSLCRLCLSSCSASSLSFRLRSWKIPPSCDSWSALSSALVSVLDNVPQEILKAHGLAEVCVKLKGLDRLPKQTKLAEMFSCIEDLGQHTRQAFVDADQPLDDNERAPKIPYLKIRRISGITREGRAVIRDDDGYDKVAHWTTASLARLAEAYGRLRGLRRGPIS